MIIIHHNRAIEFLGDSHLGKPFIHGVPLHRRGDREKMVWADFERSVSQTSADFHINLGDLLDRPVVCFDVIVRAARTYVQAAERHPETQFLILQGNHDVSRDLERVSAFDVFAEIMWGMRTGWWNGMGRNCEPLSYGWHLLLFPISNSVCQTL